MVMCPPRETPTPSSATPSLLETFLELDTPPGYRAELINREIIVVPPPDGHHEDIIGRITRRLYRKAPEQLLVLGNKGLITPRGRFVPDLVVAPEGAFRDAPPWADWVGVELVGEITSSDSTRDRKAKRIGYAEAGIPLYLLVDRDRELTVLYSEPEKGDYTITLAVPFGKKLALPTPLDLELETAEFE